MQESIVYVTTNNQSVRTEAARLKLDGTRRISDVLDWRRVSFVPLGNTTTRQKVFSRRPYTSREEVSSKLLLTVDHQTHSQSLRSGRTNVQSGIFVSKSLLIEIHTETVHVSKVAVARYGHTDTLYFGTRCQLLNVTSAVHVSTAVLVVLVRLLVYAYDREDFICDEVILRLSISSRQIGEWCINMHIRWGQQRHLLFLFLNCYYEWNLEGRIRTEMISSAPEASSRATPIVNWLLVAAVMALPLPLEPTTAPLATPAPALTIAIPST